MSDFVASSRYAYSSLLPTHFKIVCLFGLLGLALAVLAEKVIEISIEVNKRQLTCVDI